MARYDFAEFGVCVCVCVCDGRDVSDVMQASHLGVEAWMGLELLAVGPDYLRERHPLAC